MYRVIFIFDIGDLYPLLEEAVSSHHLRKASEYSVRDCVHAWFRYQLVELMQLALLGNVVDSAVARFDPRFHQETEYMAERLYRQLAPAILNHKHPCVESWCAVKLDRLNLYLTFDVGPVDYGARLA